MAGRKNVYVKIPITNTRGESSLPLIKELAAEGVKLNVTAILTLDQVRGVAAALNPKVPAVVSVFAGRIADTGVDPVGIMAESKKILAGLPQAELLWASVREVLNIFQANDCGCHIVTVPHDILGKALKMAGMDLGALSLDTVKMFANDAKAAGFTLCKAQICLRHGGEDIRHFDRLHRRDEFFARALDVAAVVAVIIQPAAVDHRVWNQGEFVAVRPVGHVERGASMTNWLGILSAAAMCMSAVSTLKNALHRFISAAVSRRF